ncbi:MAG: hypothetical protein ACRDTE_22820 [Pseudonocardiaceae bacterium]
MGDEPRAVSGDWSSRPLLSGTDLIDFLALRRVCGRPDSRVRQVGGNYVENERPVLPFIADGVTALIEVGHVRLGELDSCVTRPVVVTGSGRARYEDLCDRQGIPPYPTWAHGGKPSP